MISQCAGTRFATKYLELVNDIDCSAGGTIAAMGSFYGKLNGNGFELRNVVLQGGTSNSGLFTSLVNAELTNLALKNISFSSAAGTNSGAVAGTTTGSIITKIRLRGSTLSGGNVFGGLFGTSATSTFQDIAIVSSTISSNSTSLGGILGTQSGNNTFDTIGLDRVTLSSSTDNVGGLVGSTNGNYTSSFTNTTILASSITGRGYLGGLFGLNSGCGTGITDEGYIRNLTITSTGGSNYVGGVLGDGCYKTISDFDIKGLTINCGSTAHCAGVSGRQTYSDGTGRILRTTVEATINSTSSQVGGIVGRMGVGVQECSAKITTSCRYSCGGIAGEQDSDTIVDSSTLVNFSNTNGYLYGGITGYMAAGSMLRVTASGTITGGANNYNMGGIVGELRTSAGDIDTAVSNVNILNGAGRIGGIVGDNYVSNAKLKNVYAYGLVNGASTVGGIVGSTNSGTTSPVGAYWDPVTTGRSVCAGNATLSGCTTAARAITPLINAPSANSETVNSIPTVSGTATIGSTVRLYRSGVLATSPVADGTTGEWQAPTSAFPGIGYYGLTTKYDGSTSSDPQFFSVWHTSGIVTNVPPGGSVTGLHPQFCGTAPPMATIKLYINGSYDAETQSNIEGQWCYNTVANFPLGNVDLGVKTYDLNGDLVSDTTTTVVGN
jgi:hypothetical protein